MNDTIGIIGAMEIEVESLKNSLTDMKEECFGGIKFYTGTIFSKNVVIAKCGIGKVFAAICTEIMIIKYNPRLIVNTGVGGAIAKGIGTGDVVIASKLCQHDMDTSAIGDPVGLVSGINRIWFDCQAHAVEILENAAKSLGLNYRIGAIATGDKFISSAEDKERIHSLFGADACEMEGGAVAQAAFVGNTPFCVVRAISDSADGEATMDYPTFLPIAARNSTQMTLALIREY